MTHCCDPETARRNQHTPVEGFALYWQHEHPNISAKQVTLAMALIPKNYARLESGYREKALKIYPWVCGRCSREFVYSNRRELTVHHIDHDHTNNPEDGSNWELLCLFCHDHEHSKYTEADMYGTRVVAGEDAQNDVEAATYNPFADLKSMLNKKK